MVAKRLGSGGGARAPWMPKYGRDFYNDEHVLAMTWEQRGVYDFLLWFAWDEGSIPADTAKLARICQIHPRAFAKVWDGIRVCWSPHPDRPDRLIQRRLEAVRGESGELSKKMSELAKRRWEREAAARIAAGQHAKTDAGTHADRTTTPHPPPHPTTECAPQC